jgi:putative two-component system response regulator
MSVSGNDGNGIAVTLVEHDERQTVGLTSALRQWHLGFQLARTVNEGLNLFRAHPTPVLISELHAPGDDGKGRPGGLALAVQVKEQWPEASVLLLAGDEEAALEYSCLVSGANRLLRKPVALPELRFAIDAALAEAELRCERRRHRAALQRRLRRQASRLRARLSSAISSLFLMLEFRDPVTHAHSLRVRRYAMLLAEHLGFDRKHVREIGLAAQLHDIGKIGIDENILRKPCDLSVEEVRAVQTHTVIGENIVRPIVRSPRVLAGIRNHHERIDGRGYPDQLAGAAIPLEARLVSVVDCFDAITSCRPYRGNSLPAVEAVELLHRQTDGHLDPALVIAFQHLVEANPYPIQEVQELG